MPLWKNEKKDRLIVGLHRSAFLKNLLLSSLEKNQQKKQTTGT
jgi:hypothetical protein